MLIYFNEYIKPTAERPDDYGFVSVRHDTMNNFIVFHVNECGLTSTVQFHKDESIAAAKAILAHFENLNKKE